MTTLTNADWFVKFCYERHERLTVEVFLLYYVVLLHCDSKKVPTFKLFETLSNVNRFSEFLHCWKVYEICYKTHTTPTHQTLGMLLSRETKNSTFFCSYLVEWKKMQPNCILSAPILIPLRVLLCIAY